MLFIGRFLADPTDVPTEVVDYLAEQLDIADPSCVKAYRVREMTRLEHATQIRDAYVVRRVHRGRRGAGAVGGRPGVDPPGTARRPCSTGALVWLREHQVLLPGVSTLAQLVA